MLLQTGYDSTASVCPSSAAASRGAAAQLCWRMAGCRSRPWSAVAAAHGDVRHSGVGGGGGGGVGVVRGVAQQRSEPGHTLALDQLKASPSARGDVRDVVRQPGGGHRRHRVPPCAVQGGWGLGG
jgi:hypothetical protein